MAAITRQQLSGSLLLMALALLWICLRGKFAKGFMLAVAYGALWGLSHLLLGIKGFQTIWLFCSLGRNIIIPLTFADGIVDAPTGTLLSVFSKLRLPKAFGISTVVLLRYAPTIAYELRAIRASLKFRGIGIGFWNTVLHLPSNFERTLLPMLIRTTHISEELSAAAMVRGVRMNGDIISYDEVRITPLDCVIGCCFGGAIVFVWLLDRFLL
jgi:energy-coupling factor transport system permease protein